MHRGRPPSTNSCSDSIPAAPASSAPAVNLGHRCLLAMSGTRTVMCSSAASRHGPCPVCSCKASTTRGSSPRRRLGLHLLPAQHDADRALVAARDEGDSVLHDRCKRARGVVLLLDLAREAAEEGGQTVFTVRSARVHARRQTPRIAHPAPVVACRPTRHGEHPAPVGRTRHPRGRLPPRQSQQVHALGRP